MRCLVMFMTAICLLFLLKLKSPKNKSVDVLVIVRLYANNVTPDFVSQTVTQHTSW